MKLTTNIARGKSITLIAVLLILSSMIFLQGCGHHNSGALSFASHKVSLKRGGITHRFGVEERDGRTIFRYDGYSLTGTRLQVEIENDKVAINDNPAGMLKQGDSIRITDDGMTVNALDHGQTAKYLQENANQAPKQTASK